MRIAGVEIPYNKRLVIALTYIHGIGLYTSESICSKLNIDHSVRVKDISSDIQKSLIAEIEKYKVEGDLRSKVMRDIKRLIGVKSYRGIRHRMSLPARGQNTRNNAKNAKRFNGKV